MRVVVLKEHFGLNEELGTLKDIKASIIVKADVPPEFCKHRPLQGGIKEGRNIISTGKHSDWAALIALVGKREQSLCLCGD